MNKFIKYFLCIFFSILAINFIVSIIAFCSNISDYLIPSKIEKDPKNDSLVSIGKKFESTLDDTIYELKETHGEDYPALGIVYYRTVSHYSSITVVQNFLFSIVAGFALGNIIFFIFVAKFKSYKLVIFLILALLATAILLSLSDILTYVANNEEIQFGFPEIFWNMETSAIPYIIACLVLCGIHKVYSVYVEIQNS